MSKPIPDCPNCHGRGSYFAMEWEGGDERNCPCVNRPGLLVAIILENFLRKVAKKSRRPKP